MQWSLYAGNKKPGTSFKGALVTLYRWSLYREKFELKTQGRTTTWLLKTGGRCEKVVVKTGLTELKGFFIITHTNTHTHTHTHTHTQY